MPTIERETFLTGVAFTGLVLLALAVHVLGQIRDNTKRTRQRMQQVQQQTERDAMVELEEEVEST